jgi:hypothetical protein
VPGTGTPPDSNFYVTVFDGVTYATPDLDPNREICLVTGNSAGTLTWTRAQLGTSASTHPSGSKIIAAITDQDIKLLASGIGDYAVDSGSANALVAVGTSMYPTSLVAGMQAAVKVLNSNTAGTTLNFANLGVKTVTRLNGAALQANDVIAGMVATFIYDGTNWQLTNPNIGNTNLVNFNNTVPNVVLVGKSNGAGTSITGIAVSSGVATVNQTAHGYATGDWVPIAGATGGGVGDINQLHQITVTDANHYTFITTATGTIGGTILAMFWFSGPRVVGGSLVKNVVRNGTADYTVTFTNTQSDIYYPDTVSASNTGTTFLAAYYYHPAKTTTTFRVTFADSGGTSADANGHLKLIFTGII